MIDKPTAIPCGCEIQSDASRNLIRIAYFGPVKAADMPACVDQMIAGLSLLRPGFTVVADLSRLDSMELECAAGIAQIMEACRSHHVGTVVRIIPDPSKDIGLNILSVVHYRGSARVVTCRSVEEADRVLNNS